MKWKREKFISFYVFFFFLMIVSSFTFCAVGHGENEEDNDIKKLMWVCYGRWSHKSGKLHSQNKVIKFCSDAHWVRNKSWTTQRWKKGMKMKIFSFHRVTNYESFPAHFRLSLFLFAIDARYSSEWREQINIQPMLGIKNGNSDFS